MPDPTPTPPRAPAPPDPPTLADRVYKAIEQTSYHQAMPDDSWEPVAWELRVAVAALEESYANLRDRHDRQGAELAQAKEDRNRTAGENDRLRRRVEELAQWEPRMWPTDTPADVRITAAKNFLMPIVQAFDALNGDANYSVTSVTTAEGRGYEVTVRRHDKPSPHDLRKAADAERDSLAGKLADIAALVGGPDVVARVRVVVEAARMIADIGDCTCDDWNRGSERQACPFCRGLAALPAALAPAQSPPAPGAAQEVGDGR